MKFKKVLAALIMFTLLLGMGGCTQSVGEKPYIAVITKATQSDFWNNVQRGVNAAATEYNTTVSFEGPENEEDSTTQNELIVKAVANGADAIVLSAIDREKSADAVKAAATAGVKIVVIDSGVNSEWVSAVIGTDNSAAGARAASAVIDGTKSLEKINIGLINYDRNTENGQLREEGFRNYISTFSNARVISSIHVKSNITSVSVGVTTMLREHPEINVLVGFNEWMTLGIGETIDRLGLKDQVFAVGFDNNVETIGMLEKGVLDALIVQNPFAIGYLGVESAYNLVTGNAVQDTTVTQTVTITQKNMYSSENQKLLFKFE